MIGRAALIKVKLGCDLELARTFEQDVIPLIRKEKGFRGLFAFILPGGNRALSLSFWDQSAESEGKLRTTSGAPLAWREWSCNLGWFKSKKSRIPHPAPWNG
jgi:hypothetical protein